MENHRCPACSDLDVRMLYEVNGLQAFRCHSCGRTFHVEISSPSEDRDALLTHPECHATISAAGEPDVKGSAKRR